LNRFDQGFISRNTDFERYRRQVQYAQYGIDLSQLQDSDASREREIILALDRYKYLRLLEETWNKRPERMWYVFMEADGYLIRKNLMTFLSSFNAEENYFFGNRPHSSASDPFALSGSTFILSVGAMRRLFPKKNQDMLKKNWENRIQEFKTGYDLVLAALENEIRLTPNETFPSISGFNPATAPFGPGSWCEPIISLQGLRPEDQSDLWRYERDRTQYQHLRSPLAFEDMYIAFVKPQDLFLSQTDWDNLSSDETNAEWNIAIGVAEKRGEEEKEAESRNNIANHMRQHQHGHPHAARRQEEQPIVTAPQTEAAAAADSSFEACRETCNQIEQCFQYSYSSIPVLNHNGDSGSRCHLSRKLRFGVHKFPEEVKTESGEVLRRTWKSGWRKDRLERWAASQKCKERWEKLEKKLKKRE